MFFTSYSISTRVALSQEEVLAYLSNPANHANLKTSLRVSKSEPEGETTHVVFVDTSYVMGFVPYSVYIYASFTKSDNKVTIMGSSAGLVINHEFIVDPRPEGGCVITHNINLGIPLMMYAMCIAWPVIAKARSAHHEADARMADILSTPKGELAVLPAM